MGVRGMVGGCRRLGGRVWEAWRADVGGIVGG